MSEYGYIIVCNWEHRQHHKYDGPPWHKVYNALLHDDDYLSLTAADRGILHCLWMLASMSGDGRVSANSKSLARRLNVRRVSLEPLIQAGFIEITGTKRVRKQSRSVTTETEKSREEKNHVDQGSISTKIRGRIWAAYEAHHPEAKLTQDRKRLIDTRLGQGFTEEQLVEAIEGNHRDPYCNGENQTGKQYHALELILRNADKIEQYANVPAAKNGHAASKTQRQVVSLEHIRTEEIIKRGVPAE